MMLNGIIYRYRYSIAWRDLPEVLDPRQTVWAWDHSLAVEGTLDMIVRTLIAQVDAEDLVDRSVSVDSTIARANRYYTNVGVEPPDNGIDRSRDGLSTKVHRLVDGNCLPLVAVITPCQAGDSPVLLLLSDTP